MNKYQRLKRAAELLENTAFTLGFRQDFVNFVAFLEKNNISIEDHAALVNREKELFLAHQKAERHSRKVQRRIAQKFPKCKVCKAQMIPQPVNSEPGDQVGGNWQSILLCTNQECFETELSGKSIAEWQQRKKQ